MIETDYDMTNINETDIVSSVLMSFDGLTVRIDYVDNGMYSYKSKSLEDDDFVIAPTNFSLPTAILHAHVFFGMLLPGAVTIDHFKNAEYQF